MMSVTVVISENSGCADDYNSLFFASRMQISFYHPRTPTIITPNVEIVSTALKREMRKLGFCSLT